MSTTGNPWLDAGRSAVAAEAEERIRAAGTVNEVGRIVRTALEAILGRSVTLQLKAGTASLASIRETALGLVRAASRDPERFPDSVLARHLPRADKSYVVTRVSGEGHTSTVFNAHWLSERTRADLQASLVADRVAGGGPDNWAEFVERHVATRPIGSREHRSEPAPRRQPDAMDRYFDLGHANSLGVVTEHLRQALTDITGRPVRVNLGSDDTTDTDTAREAARGLIRGMLEQRPSGLTAVDVGTLSGPESGAYAETVPGPDGTYTVVFDEDWFSSERRTQLTESLAADAEGPPSAPKNVTELATHQVPPPEAGRTRATNSPRGEVTPEENIRRIQRASSPDEIARNLYEGLGTTLGHKVDVSFPSGTDVQTAREVAAEILREAGEKPKRLLRRVAVEPFVLAHQDEFAFTRVHPDGSFDMVFNEKWHADGRRDAYRTALDTAHAAGDIPDPTPSGVAKVRFNVFGGTALQPHEHIDRIEKAGSLAEVETHLRAAMAALTGGPVKVTLQEPESPYVTSLDTMKEVSRGLIEKAAEYPGTPVDSVRVERIYDNDADRTVNEKTYAQVVPWKLKSSDIVFNAHWHSEQNRTKYVENLDEHGSKVFGRPYGTWGTPEKVARHEFGHVVSLANPGWMKDGGVAAHEGSLQDEIRKDMGSPGASWRQITDSVSEYAATNEEEFVADAVVVANEPGSTVVTTTTARRLNAANRQRAAPLETYRRNTYESDTAAAVDVAQKGLGRVAPDDTGPRPTQGARTAAFQDMARGRGVGGGPAPAMARDVANQQLKR